MAGPEKICPSCKNKTNELLSFDADMKGRIAGDLGLSTVPSAVCPNCYNQFGIRLGKEAQKKSRRIAKEQHRLTLWRSRVHLIREARDRFAMKDFPGSVVAYEKYFRVLEIIYEVKPNEIKVEHFNNSARSKELVVIASAFWDMVRIYDQTKKFAKRLDQCADKLSEFLPFTPIYGEVLRKIEEYKKSAKNKEVFDRIVRNASKSKGRCFIATAAFQDAEAPTVKTLSLFRDEILSQSTMGRTFTRVYYRLSPPVAKVLDHSPRLQEVTRSTLTNMALFLDRKYNLKTRAGRN